MKLLLVLAPLAAGQICTNFTKGSFSGDVKDDPSCRTACEKAFADRKPSFAVPDWKGEAGAGKCQCRRARWCSSCATRNLCEDADYKPPADDPCFHGDDTVALEAGGVRKISEVQVGDRILSADRSGGLSYSDVVFVPHAPNGRPSAFLELTLASGKTVRPTPRHLLKLCGDDGALATAASLDPGACLLTADGADVLVSKRPFEAHGAYTAVAMQELIVVSGVVASPFAYVHWAPHLYYQAHRWLYSAFPALLHSPAVHRANEYVGEWAMIMGRANELVGDKTVAPMALLLPALSL